MDPTSGTKHKKLRLNYIIYPQFQLKLIVFNILFIMIAFMIAGLQMFRSFNHFKELGASLKLPPDHIFYQYIDYQYYSCLGNILFAALISVILTTAMTIYLSYKLAGPIVRLRGFFKKIAEGEPVTEIKFRDKDYFSDLPEHVNRALAKITEKEPK